MAGEAENQIPETGAVFTFGKSKFADNIPSKFWLKNDVPLEVACGDEHTAVVTDNGKLYVFGSNNWGQLGLGSKVTVSKPTCVKALKPERLHLVACGRNHTLVCTVDGQLFSSGGNSEGQLGLGDCDERTTFHRVQLNTHGPIKVLAAGSNTSAALTESGQLFMWGDNSEGQIGLGKQSHVSRPQEVTVGRRVRYVSCGYYHSALITVDGELFTFGETDCGKLGLSPEQLSGHRLPQRVKGISDPVLRVSCGGGHTVALTDEDVYTFGLGQYGQLGHGTFIFDSRLPRHVEHFRKGRVCDVSCGENHTALITDSGLLYTFGDGRHGKLALGEENFTNQFKPTLCPRFLSFTIQTVSCGGCHMAVVARPRLDSEAELSLEEDDSTEDPLERPYVELYEHDRNLNHVSNHDQTDGSLRRSLSARVRRREMERSPEQFGSIFKSLPVSVTTVGLLPPLSANQKLLQPLSSNQRQQLPSEEKRKVQSGKKPHGETCSVAESLSDSESVAGLGDSTDFLNVTHVMQMDTADSSDKTLTLSPVQKRWHLQDSAQEEEEAAAAEPREEVGDEECDDEESRSDESSDETVETPEQEVESDEEESALQEPKGAQQEVTPREEEPNHEAEQPTNGTTESCSDGQSGRSKKLSLFRKLSFSRSKQTDPPPPSAPAPAPAQSSVSGDTQADPPPPSFLAPAQSSISGDTQPAQAPDPGGGNRGPSLRAFPRRSATSGACVLL